jgi:hypothetical protein
VKAGLSHPPPAQAGTREFEREDQFLMLTYNCEYMAKHSTVGLDEYQTAFVKLLETAARRHRKHEVFRDFCELAALSLSNAVDLRNFDQREARYMQIVGRYEATEVAFFPQMLARVVQSLERGMHDCMGQLFMALELGDHWKGQYFTPYEVAYLMAELGTGDVGVAIEEKGYVRMNEPAAGAGAMVIALADSVQNKGFNYQQCLHVTAQDLDETAVHMAYIQLTLLHIPAVVVHGNSLCPKPTDARWFTAAHILGGWGHRLAADDAAHRRNEKIEVKELPDAPRQPAGESVLPQNSVYPVRMGAEPGQMSLFE